MLPTQTQALPNTSLFPVPQGVVLQITPVMIHYAKMIAMARSNSNDATRKDYQDLGGKKANLRADGIGAVAEIIIYQALEATGQRPTYTLVSDRPVKAPDFTLAGCSFEVKCCPPESSHIRISASGHNNPRKRPDYYIAAIMDTFTTLRIMQPIPASDVDNWQLVTSGHSPYYSIHKNALKPLFSLSNLLEVADMHHLLH